MGQAGIGRGVHTATWQGFPIKPGNPQLQFREHLLSTSWGSQKLGCGPGGNTGLWPEGGGLGEAGRVLGCTHALESAPRHL